MPKRQAHILTHPVVIVFPFPAQPEKHIFLKPNDARRAAAEDNVDLYYEPKSSWKIYGSLPEFAGIIKNYFQS